MSSVWLVAQGSRLNEMEAALKQNGIIVDRISDDVFETALNLYGARGLLLIDAAHPNLDAIAASGRALVPVMIVGHQIGLPVEGTMVLRDVSDIPKATQHILDILNERDNQRRYPRAPVDLSANIGGRKGRIRDVSMYGVFVTCEHVYALDAQIQVVISLGDGAQIHLDGTVVNHRDGGVAVRCRPKRDQDLLLWLHLLLGELSKNPRFADIDPFGPFFR